jgi:hypothetical protein
MEDRMSDVTKPLFTRYSLAAAVALVLVFAGLLVLENRPGWCKYGLGFWSAAWTHCTSQHFLDPYSFSHVLHGVIFYWALYPFRSRFELNWRLVAAIAIEIGWELIENSPWVIERYRQQTASLDYAGDSIINSIGDVLSTIIGFYLASRVSWKAAVVVFVVLELWMLYAARDNLTLNVLMLFWPLESIKQWQLQAI